MYVSSPATLSICFRELLSTYSQHDRFGTASVQFTAIASEFMPSNLWLIMQLGRDKWTLCALSIAYHAIPWAGFRWWSVIMHCYANAVGNVLQGHSGVWRRLLFSGCNIYLWFLCLQIPSSVFQRHEWNAIWFGVNFEGSQERVLDLEAVVFSLLVC